MTTPTEPAQHPEIDQLEACAAAPAGSRASPEVAQVELHAATCADCARELEWLRHEHQLFSARARESERAAGAAEVARLWSAVAARLETKPVPAVALREPEKVATKRPAWLAHLRRPLALAAFALPVAAILIVVLALRPRASLPVLPAAPRVALADEDADADRAPDPRVSLALEKAQSDTAQAIAVLEKEAASLRSRLPPEEARGWDQSLQRDRERLDAARLASAQAFNGGDDEVQSRLRILGGTTRYLRSLQEMVKDSEETPP